MYFLYIYIKYILQRYIKTLKLAPYFFLFFLLHIRLCNESIMKIIQFNH
jgi:hypothetical protein